MTLLSKVGKWAKKNAGKVASIALPVAALGVSLLPGVGGTISTGISKLGDKIKGSKVLSAVAKASDTVAPEKKKGFLGLFSGKAKAKKALENRTANEEIYEQEDKEDLDRLRRNGTLPTPLPSPSPTRPSAASADEPESSGPSVLAIAAGIGFVAWLTSKK